MAAPAADVAGDMAADFPEAVEASPAEGAAAMDVAATIAAEDRRFFRHYGVDPVAIVRAAWRNVRAGDIVEGGSTISQQAAKLLRVDMKTRLGKQVPERLKYQRMLGHQAYLQSRRLKVLLSHWVTKQEPACFPRNHGTSGLDNTEWACSPGGDFRDGAAKP